MINWTLPSDGLHTPENASHKHAGQLTLSVSCGSDCPVLDTCERAWRHAIARHCRSQIGPGMHDTCYESVILSNSGHPFIRGTEEDAWTPVNRIRQTGQWKAATLGFLLIVDDDAANAQAFESLLALDGHTVRTARDGMEALRLIRAEPPDFVLMDVAMPGFSGIEACQAIKRNPDTRLIPVVLVTGFNDPQSRLRGIEAGADDFVSKPVNVMELRARVWSLLRIRMYTEELDSAASVILSLSLTIEARDSTTDGHCQRLAHYASALGRAIGLDHEDLAALESGGFLHDIGKVGIPDAVLMKRDRLTREEYALIKQHPIIGDRLCGELRSLRRVRPIVRHHHERLDGSGYPDGLRGDATPLLAQIMGVVDVFDALTTERPYRAALPMTVAAGELWREVGRGWRRRDLVGAFLDAVPSVAHGPQLPSRRSTQAGGVGGHVGSGHMWSAADAESGG